MVARFLLTALMLAVSAIFLARRSGARRHVDDANALSAAEERDVQAALMRSRVGDPLTPP